MNDVVVITGGAGGIGVAAARMFGPGRRVVLSDVNEARLDATRAALADDGLDVISVACDVADAASVAALADTAAGAGRLGVLFHSAGLSPSMADARTILKVNYVGSWNVLEAFEPLVETGTVVVCVASMAAYRGRTAEFDALFGDPREAETFETIVSAAAGQSRPAYSLSKRGLIREVERRAADLARRGARIVSISPGIVDTEMGRLEAGGGGRGNMQVALQLTPFRRLATPEEVAGAAVLLCDPAASFITGCDLLVDGGTIAGYRHHASAEAAAGFNNPWE